MIYMIMDHLVQDLSVALEDSEPGGPANFKINRRWGIKRRTRSAGNLRTLFHFLFYYYVEFNIHKVLKWLHIKRICIKLFTFQIVSYEYIVMFQIYV